MLVTPVCRFDIGVFWVPAYLLFGPGNVMLAGRIFTLLMWGPGRFLNVSVVPYIFSVLKWVGQLFYESLLLVK